MSILGGCYCRELRFEADGAPLFRGQCCCRECQYVAGGQPNVVIGLAEPGFRYTEGTPKVFRRSDIENPVAREFCATCGTHILTRTNAMPGVVLVKVGVLDDPSIFGKPDMVIFTIDKQSFHHIPEGVPTFERAPG